MGAAPVTTAQSRFRA